MAESIVKKLIDAKDPDAVKLWADAVYQQFLRLLQDPEDRGMTIKSIQRGTVQIQSALLTGTLTIPAVDPAKTELRELGQIATGVGGVAYIVLTNSTTITATRQSTSGISTISWELTEYE